MEMKLMHLDIVETSHNKLLIDYIPKIVREDSGIDREIRRSREVTLSAHLVHLV